MALRHFILCIWSAFLPCCTLAQNTDSLVRIHSPVKASLLSAALPGAGQFYNRKYWKVPVIYAAFGGLGYLAKWNDNRYRTYRNAYRLRIDGDPSTTDDFTNLYSDNDLKLLRDYYRRNRDLTLIFTGLVYVLNIVDASVDAHLFYFDISDNLSLHIAPSLSPYQPAPSAGIFFGLKF
jgi:TM2 domain-containing membrane protein YozV